MVLSQPACRSSQTAHPVARREERRDGSGASDPQIGTSSSWHLGLPSNQRSRTFQKLHEAISAHGFRGAQQTGHRQPVPAEHPHAVAHGRAQSLPAAPSGVFVQHLARRNHLTSDECVEAPRWRQQPVDQAHVGIELGLAGTGIGSCQPDCDAAAASAPCVRSVSRPIGRPTVSGPPSRRPGGHAQRRIRTDRLIKRAGRQAGAQGVPARAESVASRRSMKPSLA